MAAGGNGDEEQDLAELVDVKTASRLLEVPESRIAVMVEEGMLTPVDPDKSRFSRAEVLALREMGG